MERIDYKGLLENQRPLTTSELESMKQDVGTMEIDVVNEKIAAVKCGHHNNNEFKVHPQYLELLLERLNGHNSTESDRIKDMECIEKIRERMNTSSDSYVENTEFLDDMDYLISLIDIQKKEIDKHMKAFDEILDFYVKNSIRIKRVIQEAITKE